VIVSKFKLMRSGSKTITVYSLLVWVEWGGEGGVDCMWSY